jgi:hypothetical protein
MGVDSEEPNLKKLVVQGGFRVERNLTLCGLLNGDVGTFVVLNFENKSMSPVFLAQF